MRVQLWKQKWNGLLAGPGQVEQPPPQAGEAHAGSLARGTGLGLVEDDGARRFTADGAVETAAARDGHHAGANAGDDECVNDAARGRHRVARRRAAAAAPASKTCSGRRTDAVRGRSYVAGSSTSSALRARRELPPAGGAP